jgi:hypothetical protein
MDNKYCTVYIDIDKYLPYIYILINIVPYVFILINIVPYIHHNMLAQYTIKMPHIIKLQPI